MGGTQMWEELRRAEEEAPAGEIVNFTHGTNFTVFPARLIKRFGSWEHISTTLWRRNGLREADVN